MTVDWLAKANWNFDKKKCFYKPNLDLLGVELGTRVWCGAADFFLALNWANLEKLILGVWFGIFERNNVISGDSRS